PFLPSPVSLLALYDHGTEIGKIRGKTKCSASNLPQAMEATRYRKPAPARWLSPHHRLRDLAKKYGPLMHLKLGEAPILAAKILSYDSTNIGFAPYGEYWRQLRKICTLELLSIKRVRSSDLLEKKRAGSPVNLTQEIYSSTFTITSRAAFGKKNRDQEKFIYIVKEAVKALSGFALADVFPSVSLLHLLSGMRPKLERLHKEADRILGNIIKEHQRNMVTTKSGEGEAEEDLVDVLLKFHDHGNELEFSLTTENIKAVIFDIFAAGSETSSTAVDWAIAEMIKNPRVMNMAQNEVREVFNRKGQVDETCIREMKYLNLVIKETLRLHPPGPLLVPRECREKCEIDGYEIPVKSKVIVNAWAIGRDPNYWNEPDSFNPDRFLDSSIDYKGTNFEYIPFGAGRRMCPGMSFGLANVELPLALLLYHFDWKLPDGMKHEDLDMTEAFGAAVKRKDDLHLIPIPYHPPPTEKS
ncbi:cytochrome P450, family 71, subfamily B, polypeptide 34, partial [Prunus dulcis]